MRSILHEYIDACIWHNIIILLYYVVSDRRLIRACKSSFIEFCIRQTDTAVYPISVTAEYQYRAYILNILDCVQWRVALIPSGPLTIHKSASVYVLYVSVSEECTRARDGIVLRDECRGDVMSSIYYNDNNNCGGSQIFPYEPIEYTSFRWLITYGRAAGVRFTYTGPRQDVGTDQ